MRLLTFILFPLFVLFTSIPVNVAFACGNGSNNGNCCKKDVKQEVNSCCQKTNKHESTCGDSNNEKENPNHKDCHCPSTCINTFVAVVSDIKLISPFKVHNESSTWFFPLVAPPTVYLSIWIPPKIR
jgi:hypothetical protein